MDSPLPSNLPQEESINYSGLFRLVFITLFILAITVSLFIYREIVLARRQTSELHLFIAEYEKNQVPAMKEFHTRMSSYAQTNSEYRALFSRYFGSRTNTSPLKSE
ncbi:MAG: hypothetical protein SFY81_14675 [Verrucomicrobiota bacterium]|nr:hypothetical protein [Verrucomicrobiota bacterium]